MNKEKVILDTDIENEVDDLFALTYLMKSLDAIEVEAITIAPFSKSGYSDVLTISEGIDKSYATALYLLDLLGIPFKNVYKGSRTYCKEAKEPIEAVDQIIKIAHRNSKTTIVAIGALTNIALAFQKDPHIIPKVKVIWLGGNSFLSEHNDEFNFRQDIKAVQTVYDSKVELVVIPCRNVASMMVTTTYELEHYLLGKGELGAYLCRRFRDCKKAFIKTPEDSVGSGKVLWDLSAIGYLLNPNWFKEQKISCPEVLENGDYKKTSHRHSVTFVTDCFRNKIYQDFFLKMGWNCVNE